MNRLSALVIGFLFSLGVFFLAPAAHAETVALEGGCTYKGGVDCKASCTNLKFDAICNAELSANCNGQCTAAADVSCTGSCQGDCKAACTADPPKFSCRGRCTANCSASCDAKCSANTNGATSQADCKAKCEAGCQASCEGTCDGTPPSAQCEARCQACCSGECRGKANIDCQVACQVKGTATCEAKYSGDCDAKCTTTGGVIVCDGAAQAFVDGVKAAADWVAAHVTFTSDFSSSCESSNGSTTCQAQGSASATTNCAVSPGETANNVALAVGAAFVACFFMVRRRRRQALQLVKR